LQTEDIGPKKQQELCERFRGLDGKEERGMRGVTLGAKAVPTLIPINESLREGEFGKAGGWGPALALALQA
jgi:hypothetical protein